MAAPSNATAANCGIRRLGDLANAELAQPSSQGARVEAQDAGRAMLAFDDPTCAFENAPDVRALHLLEARLRRNLCRRDGVSGTAGQKVSAVERRTRRHDHRP